jgi:predicted DNA-binding transcriptional regulator AlpA
MNQVMTETIKPKIFLRPKKAAAYLGISRSTLWTWSKTQPGFPQAIKIGPRATVFDVEKLDSYVENQARIAE